MTAADPHSNPVDGQDVPVPHFGVVLDMDVFDALAARLKAAGVRYEAFVYDGVEHGFNNDTTPRFDAAAAQLAWERTIALFNRALRA